MITMPSRTDMELAAEVPTPAGKVSDPPLSLPGHLHRSLADELVICLACNSPMGDRAVMEEGQGAAGRGPRRRLRYCGPCEGGREIASFTPTLVKLTSDTGSLLRETLTRETVVLRTSTPKHRNPNSVPTGYHTPTVANPLKGNLNPDQQGIIRDGNAKLDLNSNLRLFTCLDNISDLNDSVLMGSALDKLENKSLENADSLRIGETESKSQHNSTDDDKIEVRRASIISLTAAKKPDPGCGGGGVQGQSETVIARDIGTDMSVQKYITNISAQQHVSNTNTRQHTSSTSTQQSDESLSYSSDDLISSPGYHSSSYATSESEEWVNITQESDNSAFLQNLALDNGNSKRAENQSESGGSGPGSSGAVIERFCDDHPSIRTTCYCRECKREVCDSCMGHSTHGLVALVTYPRPEKHRQQQQRHKSDYVRDRECRAAMSLENIAAHERDLFRQKEVILSLLEERKGYYHKAIERWHDKLITQLETALAREVDALNQEKSQLTNQINELQDLVNASTDAEEEIRNNNNMIVDFREVSQPRDTLQMCFGAAACMSGEALGTLSIQKARSRVTRANSPLSPHPALQPYPALVTSAVEISNFESRSGDHCDYMANGLSLTAADQIIVTDIGKETVKLFNARRRLICNLNVLHADQPTSAVMLPSGHVAVACQTEVKLYKQQRQTGVYLHSLWPGFQSPQCLKLHQGELLVSEFTSLDHVTYTKSNSQMIHVFQADTLEKVDSIIWRDANFRSSLVTRARYFTPHDNGDVIASDHDDHTLKVIGGDGEVRRVIGGQGMAVGQFYLPAGVCIDPLGNILVADSGNHRVQVISPQGEPLGVVVNKEEHDLCWPTDVAVNSHGHLVVLQGDGKVRTFKYVQYINKA